MTNDDRFDDLLKQAAREHNQAPETPRAEMWSAITAARAASANAAAPHAEERVPDVRIIPLVRRDRRALAWIAALAASLLIGVVIGRSGVSNDTTPVTTSPAAAQGTAPDNGQPPTTATMPGNPDRVPAAATASGPAPGGRVAARSPNVLVVAADAGTARAADPRRGSTRNPLARRAAADDAALPYRLAAMQHLVTTEALLVSLRGDLRTGRKDTTIAVWAGDLLGTTRVLIDSPAGHDPQLKQLLEDLELVLAQISRLPGARGEAADLGLIDDAVRHREIMTRLRALSPNT